MWCALSLAAVALSAPAVAQTTSGSPPAQQLVGTWTLNRDLSDNPDGQTARQSGRRSGGGGGGGRRGGFGGRGGGGFGGGFGGGGLGGGSTGDPEERQRAMQAMRDEMTAADRLTIVQTDSMIIMTTGDGRTTRLSPNGKSIKDDSTHIERKTKWDGAKLVSEISGIGRGKVTETYAIDPESHRLRLTLSVPDMRGAGQPTTLTRVYDASDEGAQR